MPWRDHSPMSSRLQFIQACLDRTERIVDICARFGISEKTGQKWLARVRAHGIFAGVAERVRPADRDRDGSGHGQLRAARVRRTGSRDEALDAARALARLINPASARRPFTS
jgi:transposase-like protein